MIRREHASEFGITTIVRARVPVVTNSRIETRGAGSIRTYIACRTSIAIGARQVVAGVYAPLGDITRIGGATVTVITACELGPDAHLSGTRIPGCTCIAIVA